MDVKNTIYYQDGNILIRNMKRSDARRNEKGE